MNTNLSRIRPAERGVLAPGRWLWPRATVWMLVLFAVTTLAFFASFQLSDWFPGFKGHGYAVAILIPVAMLLLYAGAVRLWEHRAVTEFALSKAPLELIAGAAIGFAFITLVLLLLWALGLYSVAPGHWQHAFHYLVFNAYVSAMLEELAFRAILLRIFARMFGPMAGLVISAALFGLAHASHASPVAIAELVINGGMFLGLIYVVSGRLWLAIGAHVAYDFTEWSLMGVGDKDGLLAVAPVPGHPAWLTGGEFGPDGSVLAAVVGVLLIAAILAYSRRSNARRCQSRHHRHRWPSTSPRRGPSPPSPTRVDRANERDARACRDARAIPSIDAEHLGNLP